MAYNKPMKFFIRFCERVVEQSSQKHRLSNFDRFCVFVIIVDGVLIVAETFEVFYGYGNYFNFAMWFIIGIFTVEYFIRLIGHKDRRAFIFSFYGLIDLIAFLPMYLTLGLVDVSFVRVFRLFKFFKFKRYFRFSDVFMDSLKAIRQEMTSVTIFFLSIVYVSSILIYHFESHVQPDQISNVLDGLYLAIVTATTLGYGDITPITLLGKITTTMLALVSILFVAIPSALFISEYSSRKAQSKRN